MNDRSATAFGLAYSFGPFRLAPARQLLLKGEPRVCLRSRAFEIPVVLPEGAALERARAHNMRVRQTRPIDRARTISALAARLPKRRLMTIIGAAGLGKITMALAVAETLVSVGPTAPTLRSTSIFRWRLKGSLAMNLATIVY